MQGVAVSANDVLGLLHFLLKRRIVGRKLICTVRSFDQKKAVTFTGMQAVDGLLGKDDAQGIANFANLQFQN